MLTVTRYAPRRPGFQLVEATVARLGAGDANPPAALLPFERDRCSDDWSQEAVDDLAAHGSATVGRTCGHDLRREVSAEPDAREREQRLAAVPGRRGDRPLHHEIVAPGLDQIQMNHGVQVLRERERKHGLEAGVVPAGIQQGVLGEDRADHALPDDTRDGDPTSLVAPPARLAHVPGHDLLRLARGEVVERETPVDLRRPADGRVASGLVHGPGPRALRARERRPVVLVRRCKLDHQAGREISARAYGIRDREPLDDPGPGQLDSSHHGGEPHKNAHEERTPHRATR